MRLNGTLGTAFVLSAALIVGGAGAASAAELAGVWQRSDGTSRIRMAPCGGAVCGSIIWLKKADSPARVGQRVFYDMKPDGAGWTGKAFNPEDGKTYTGKMSLSGDSLTTKGCALGGLICKSVSWRRSN